MSLSDVAYQRFKEHLFARRLPLGGTVSQAALVALLEVPVTPLRDAMRVLQSEGLIEVIPRSGVRILKPDMELIRHTYQLRRMIEREAVARFAEACPPERITAWRAQHADLAREAETDADPRLLASRTAAIDDGFHAAIVAALKNPIIDGVYRQTKDRIRLIRLDQAYVLSPVKVRDTMAEHGRVLDALARHDRDGAVAAMDHHLTRSMHRAMGV